MNIKDLLKEMELVAKNNSYPIIGSEKAEFLAGLVREKRPKIILEIGTLIGYSSIVMAINQIDAGKIVSLEGNTTSAKLAQRNIKKAGFEGKINIIVGKALAVLPELRGNFDFVFIDADKNEYFEYFQAVQRLLNKDAVVVADNVARFPKEMEEFLSQVRQDKSLHCENVRFGDDAMEIIKRL